MSDLKHYLQYIDEEFKSWNDILWPNQLTLEHLFFDEQKSEVNLDLIQKMMAVSIIESPQLLDDINLWMTKNLNGKQKSDKTRACVNCQSTHIVEKLPEGFVNNLKVLAVDFFSECQENAIDKGNFPNQFLRRREGCVRNQKLKSYYNK